ncbi:hypothetical protein [Rufibacter latericius]|uniref:DUF4249 family protein n=1 Tax=Rufibacter latericius TaxID=2487040 RepID=A0A3M9MZ03_9BACT|nr:hypothetical protein [Rufibacter latericius]RNI30710.1 hypothetical protein EFB08_05545 [Rufibacter latericius]
MKRILLFVVLLTSLLSSCGDEEITRDPDSLGYQYYPLAIGNYWIFNVTENKYTLNVITQTTTYQSRERIDGTITDQTGREWYRVELSRRSNPEASWVVSGVKLISMSSSDLRIQENNQTFVKMVFPVKKGYSFVTNGFVDAVTYDYVYLTYSDLGKTIFENGTTYDNTLTVIQEDFEKLYDLREQSEILSFNLGPIKRSLVSFDYCNTSDVGICEVGTGFIVNGTEKIEVLESSGKTE